MQEKIREFFMTRPIQELDGFTNYFDYPSLYRDILTPDNQANLPKPLEEILSYKALFGDERTFRKLGFDYDNLGVDLKAYFDYDLYTKEYIEMYDVTEKDVSALLNEDGPNIFEELEESMREKVFLHTMAGKAFRSCTKNLLDDYDENYIDEDER